MSASKVSLCTDYTTRILPTSRAEVWDYLEGSRCGGWLITSVPIDIV